MAESVTSTNRSTRSARPPKPQVNFATADDQFAAFFCTSLPIVDPVALDRISLLACERQGVAIQDLLPAKQAPRPKRQSPAVAAALEAKATVEVRRRTAVFTILQQERAHLLGIISSAASGDRLTHEQVQIQTELSKQRHPLSHAEPRSNLPGEADDIDRLLNHVHDLAPERARLAKTIEETRRKGEEDVERLRQRHLRFIAHDVALEQQREEMLDAIAKREHEFKAAQAQRDAARKVEAQRVAKLHRRKINALRIRNAALHEMQAEEFSKRSAAHEKLWKEVVKRRAEEVERRKEISEAKCKESKEKAERVWEEAAAKCNELEEELNGKVLLHDERRANLQLQLEIQREERRIAAMQRQYQARQHVTQKDDGASKTRRRLDERDAAAQQLIADKKRATQARLEQQRRDREEAFRKISERQQRMDEKKAEKDVALLRREIEMEQRVEEARLQKLQEVEVQAALEQQKMHHHEDNMHRIQRQHEHKQAVKAALIAEVEERDRAARDLKYEMSKKMQAARQRLAEERERVEEEMARNRSSPKRKNMTAEEILASSLRAASTPRAHTSQRRPHRQQSAASSPAAAEGRPATAAEPSRSADRSQDRSCARSDGRKQPASARSDRSTPSAAVDGELRDSRQRKERKEQQQQQA